MKPKKGQKIELTISGMAFGGKGIAKVDGYTIFVDQVVAEDLVLARVVRKKKNYGEARVEEILVPSPFRIDPPCRYSGYCGGCKWQFIRYDQQLFYKQQHVIESLEHIGFLSGIPVHPAIPSHLTFGYRNKMEFSCSDKRWVLPLELDSEDIDRSFALGLHVPGTFHKVLDIDECLLQPSLGNRILEDVRTYIKDSEVPVYGLRSHVGFWRFLVLRHSVACDQWMVNIITSTENRDVVIPLANRLKEKYPQIVSIVNSITDRKSGVAIGDYEIHLSGKHAITDRIGPYEFRVSSNSFFQTNTRGAEVLYRTVKNFAELTGKETVLDLYSGTGTIAIYLSGSAEEVIGIEIVESAVSDAEKNCQINQIPNCRFIHGNIRDCLQDTPLKPDVMVIDPPRAGMHKEVVKSIIDIRPERIVFVSCNPATMARDLGMMKDHYDILEVQPVDMFPHTHHIEAVVKLERR
jgi:23S rRNA (uracil1939-C5)-methyltransferase